MQRTCRLTCCCSTAFCGSVKDFYRQILQFTTFTTLPIPHIMSTHHDTPNPPWAQKQQIYCKTVSTLTPRAGRRPAETSWPLWAPWIRWRWTSSLADGSVQKWSDVFSLVYSRAQGPTDNTAHIITIITHTFNECNSYRNPFWSFRVT